jgi:hypothetical protein
MPEESQFPILGSSRQLLPTLPTSVPWSIVEPHESQAMKNHGQTLKRLADRGGLGWTELSDVIEGKSWDGRSYSSRHDPELVYREARAAMLVLRHVKHLTEAAQKSAAS